MLPTLVGLLETLYEFKLAHHLLHASPVLCMKLSMLHISPAATPLTSQEPTLHDSFPVQEPALRPDTIKATVNKTLCPLLQELRLFEAMTTTTKKVTQQTNHYKIFYGKRGT